MVAFHPFEVTTPHIIYICLGGFIVLFGMFSLFLRSRLYIGEACWAFLFGVIIGPYGADIFNPRSWAEDENGTNTIVLEFTRVVLAIGVFAIGVELPKQYMKKHWQSIFFLLFPVMTWGWFVSAGLIYALIPGLNFLSSLAVAACLTPTDPILAAAVVGGKWADKHVPAHLRHLLAAESGCNDGAAFPFLFIALYLILDAPDTGDAIRDWFLLLWLYQVALAIVIGALLGYAFRHLMKFCQRHDLIDRNSFVAQYVSLAMLTIGVCTLLGSDDLLAAFACGTAFAWDGFFNKQTEESNFSSVIDLLFNIACFIFIGAWMPFSSFQDEELTLSVWRLIVIAVLVLILRRLPVIIALYKWIPDVKTFREAVFSGHFGPIGVGAVFISTLAVEVIHRNHHPPEDASPDSHSSSTRSSDHQIEMLAATIQPIVAFMVLCSITIHGLSIPSFSLGRRVHSVSRTWSRQNTVPSMESTSWWPKWIRKRSGAAGGMQPDWTNQATMVSRPEDIVINRDHVREMEEGGRAVGDKLQGSFVEGSAPVSRIGSRVGFAPAAVPVPGLDTLGAGMQKTVSRTSTNGTGSGRGIIQSPPTHPPTPHPEEEQEVAQPGEAYTYTEWKEGRRRVIERSGPTSADDVDVVSVEDVSDNEDGTSRSPALTRPVEWVRTRTRSLTHPRRSRSRSGSRSRSRSRGADEGSSGSDSAQRTLVHHGSSDGVGAGGASGSQGSSQQQLNEVGEVTTEPRGEAWVSEEPQSRGRRGSPGSSRSALGSDVPGAEEDAGEEEERGRGRYGSVFGRSAGPAEAESGAPSPSGAPASAPATRFVSPPRTRRGGESGVGAGRRGPRTRSADPTLSAVRHHRVESIMASHSGGTGPVPSAGPTRESSPSRSVRFVDRVGGGGPGPGGQQGRQQQQHGRMKSARSMEGLSAGYDEGGGEDENGGGRRRGRQ